HSIMNYEYIFNKKLLDYSSGENGPENDQKDWDVLYLPHFQDIDVVIEGPYFTKLENREDYIIEKNPEPIIDGWKHDENLTELLSGKISELPTFYFDTYDYRAYVKTDEKQNQSDRDFRLYVKADIAPTHTMWVLVSEGKLKNDENIKFYSFEETIQSITE
ncbi:MAG: hypothetical protein L0Y61_04980, partial [Epsilonproteobacteria bacterium]|nr:hypothetical protein [Campylobacterota bacterium]